MITATSNKNSASPIKIEDKIMTMLRIILGLFLIGYALNQFFHLIPNSYGKMPEDARYFIEAVIPYLPYLYIFEIIIGLFIIFNKWVSLILIVLCPLSVSFLIFSYTNGDIGSTWPALFVALLNLILVWDRKEKYIPLLD